MESFETNAEGKSSSEAGDRTIAQKKGTSDRAQTKRRPSAEPDGKESDQEPEGIQRLDLCSFSEMSDSGKSLELEEKISQSKATSHSEYDVSSSPPKPTKSCSFIRHNISAESPGPASQKRSVSTSSEVRCSHSGVDQQSEVSFKIEQKPQKTGKYVCDYCGRACAKPSVLKKHIRSHTGERPYPCVPCGFSFKTKSNLYKHRKSHAHSIKAGTVPSEPGSYNENTDQGSVEGEGELFSDAEQSTDTDEDTPNDPLLLLDSPVDASDNTAVKVLNLIAQKKGPASLSAQGGPSQALEINSSSVTAEVSHSIQSSTIKQRLALRLFEKRSSDSEHNLSLPSQSSKGSTDSGYFSRSESSEHQIGPPNTNAKSYQEIMFGKCYRPSPKQTSYVTCSTEEEYSRKGSEKCVSRVFTQEKDAADFIKINTKSFTREEVKESQLETDLGHLIRSNSMPASSPVCLTMPQSLRSSHSFDERTSTGGMRRLKRQGAIELSVHDGHSDLLDSKEKMGESGVSSSGLEMQNYSCVGATMNLQRHALELATRKRRKEKREEEEMSGQYEGSEMCDDMFEDHDLKQAAMGIIALGRGYLDRYDMDVSMSSEISGPKNLGNVISVIQHTNSINRPHSEKSETSKYLAQRMETMFSFQAMQAGESSVMEYDVGQSLQLGPKLVRQPNIQVPEIRVTVEPDSPEKAPVVQVKEPEKHVEEFQWPQRSETLAQFPPEKLPPKKKRIRLAEIEHSSGESSFESACTSLSRSPSQDSNLSYSSTFSFEREESLKSTSPSRQDDKPLELLAVPGSGHSLSVLNQRQQHEMRRSSSEQVPCNLHKEFPEVRSISFDYGSLSPTSKFRHVDMSALKERKRGNLVRQESLNMDTEVTQVSLQALPQYLSCTSPLITAASVLPQTLPIFSPGITFPQLSDPSLIVPVRIQTHVPSFGSITYTSLSQIFDYQLDSIGGSLSTHQGQTLRLCGNASTISKEQIAINAEGFDSSFAKLKTGIPLSLTSRTISTTNASSGGSNKRMLSPANSLDLFMEVKQQKRVKEERMFGQIVEELSAVELGKSQLSEEMQSIQGETSKSIFIAHHKVTEASEPISDMESVSSEVGMPAYTVVSTNEVNEQMKMDMVSQLVPSKDLLISDVEHSRLLFQFPSLRTTTGVSWCYLNYTRPSCSPSNSSLTSVYATWHESSHNPNPLKLSTSAALALLRSRQGRDNVIYTLAAMCQPGTGKLVSSLFLWRRTMEQLQRKPEPKEVDVFYGKKVKEISKVRTVKEELKEREASVKQSMPTRIKIFEGGYKSNEDYVYVRGRGRGKYICEECGIRCKKPSMLKKHIRTHTDVRPYICRVCNFAFKTKGNLTKHMKSKAHMKKCLELGVSPMMEDVDIQEQVDTIQRESKAEIAAAAKHQFSDAEDSEGMDEEADDVDEEDDEDDEYEGDSTPKLRSRSTSPQAVAATAPVHGSSLTTLPGTDVEQSSGRCRGPDGRLGPTSNQREKSVDDDGLVTLPQDQTGLLFDPYSSYILSPGWESPIRETSPSRLRYPSPRRELSPRGRSSLRWDMSPLRPDSPRFKHPSPGLLEQPLSPGTEGAGKRELSVRGRQRVVLRAVSPRRGSHQHKGSCDKSRHQAKLEMAQQHGAFEMDQRSSLAPPPADADADCRHPNVLSHLPLHSQQQPRSLLPVVPVGGLQMARTASGGSPSPASSPQSREAHPEENQEESVHTCLKAIASLKITAEQLN